MADPKTPDPINSHTLIPQILKSLYDSVNVMLGNFGLSVIRLIVAVAVLIVILMVWAMIASVRNRKSFTLTEEEIEDADIPESPSRIHGGVFRKTSGPEGSARAVA